MLITFPNPTFLPDNHPITTTLFSISSFLTIIDLVFSFIVYQFGLFGLKESISEFWGTKYCGICFCWPLKFLYFM